MGIGECMREELIERGGDGNEKFEKLREERASTPEAENWEWSHSETGERMLSLETMLDMLRVGTCILRLG